MDSPASSTSRKTISGVSSAMKDKLKTLLRGGGGGGEAGNEGYRNSVGSEGSTSSMRSTRSARGRSPRPMTDKEVEEEKIKAMMKELELMKREAAALAEEKAKIEADIIALSEKKSSGSTNPLFGSRTGLGGGSSDNPYFNSR